MSADVKAQLREFIRMNYLFGDETRMPDDDESLIESGVIDSTGILELIEFLEEQFGIEVSDTDTIPQNLGTVAALSRFVMRKAGAESVGAPATAPSDPQVTRGGAATSPRP